MKHVPSSLVLALLCACSRGPAPSQGDAAAPTPPPSSAREAVMSADEPPQAAAPGEASARRGIAVGEAHPSGDVAIDAGPARYDGYGDLRFGMTAAEARGAWKGGLDGDDVASAACGYLHAAGTAAGPYLMFENDAFVRYDVRGANATAPGGGRVGMTADDIRRLYAGRVQESPHKYVEGGRYLRVADPASGERALVFEVDGHDRVTTWRAGRLPQVGYVEGCS